MADQRTMHSYNHPMDSLYGHLIKSADPNGAHHPDPLYKLMLEQQSHHAANLYQQPPLTASQPPWDLLLGSSMSHTALGPTIADLSRRRLIQSIMIAGEHQQQQQQQQQGMLSSHERMVLHQEVLRAQHQASFEEAVRQQMEYRRPRIASVLVPLSGSKRSHEVHQEASHPPVPLEKRAYAVEETAPTAKKRKVAAATDAVSRPKPAVKKASLKSAPAKKPTVKKAAVKEAPVKKAPKKSSVYVPKEKKDDKWLGMLQELKEYKATHGNCIVPRGYSPNPRLASWVAEQRKQYKLQTDGNASSITPARIEKLNALSFAWNAQEAAWERHMNDLNAFKEEHGHCHVPLSHTTYPKLGLWVKEQRRHFTLMQQGKPSHMTPARARELDEAGFCWDTHEATWLDRLRQLKDYKERHGDCLVPTHWGVNPKLGTWVNHQRHQYKRFMKGKPCHITVERVAALEAIGLRWHTRAGDRASDRTGDSVSTDTQSDGDSDSERCLPPRKRHRLMM